MIDRSKFSIPKAAIELVQSPGPFQKYRITEIQFTDGQRESNMHRFEPPFHVTFCSPFPCGGNSGFMLEILCKLGGSLVGVWIGWGYGIAFFRALKFQISEPEIWRNRSFCGNSRVSLEISASEKYFSDSGKWPFHTPPIHTPTKCRPINSRASQRNRGISGTGKRQMPVREKGGEGDTTPQQEISKTLLNSSKIP